MALVLICLSSVGICNDFALILLNLFQVILSGYRRVVFSLCCGCFCFIFLNYLLSELLINRDIWRGIFAASSGRLCWIY